MLHLVVVIDTSLWNAAGSTKRQALKRPYLRIELEISIIINEGFDYIMYFTFLLLLSILTSPPLFRCQHLWF